MGWFLLERRVLLPKHENQEQGIHSFPRVPLHNAGGSVASSLLHQQMFHTVLDARDTEHPKDGARIL